MSVVFHLPLPSPFGFRRTVLSHGWCALPPFSSDSEGKKLQCILPLDNGEVRCCSITADRSCLQVEVHHGNLSNESRGRIVRTIQSMFRLDEDFGEFYRLMRTEEEYRWIAQAGAGRLLRAPTAFEDVVRMIATTNCSWALTTAIVSNLCRLLGTIAGENLWAFPTPEQLAQSSERFLREKVRSGYRSPYLLAFSRSVAEGSFDVEALRSSSMPTTELYEHLRTIPGVGPYAAQNLLKLMGHYDYLGLDSWVRRQYAAIYHGGRRISDRTIEGRYRRFGRWKGLVFWLEMTREWFDGKFPLP